MAPTRLLTTKDTHTEDQINESQIEVLSFTDLTAIGG